MTPAHRFNQILDRVYTLLAPSGAPPCSPAVALEARNDQGVMTPGDEGASIHLLDPYRRKVDDDFNPGGYPINRRTTPAHDTGGYAPEDPKGWAA
jgi:hypothetical protein